MTSFTLGAEEEESSHDLPDSLKLSLWIFVVPLNPAVELTFNFMLKMAEGKLAEFTVLLFLGSLLA